MREQFAALVNNLITLLLMVTTLLTPLIFAPFFTEFFEIPKTVFLVTLVTSLLVLWAFLWVLNGKVLITRTSLDLHLLILLAVVLISTYLSETRYAAIFGSLPRVHGSAVTWISLIVLYFIATSHIRTKSQVKALFLSLLASTSLVAIMSLMAYFGIHLLGQALPFTNTLNFTPSGSSFSATALIILMLPLLFISIIKRSELLPTFLAVILTAIFGVTLILIGQWPVWLVALLSLALTVVLNKRSISIENLPLLLIPIILSVAILFLTNLPTNTNPLRQKASDFPREIQLNPIASWKVSVSSFRDAPFFGTGPSSYLFNFTNYKPLEHNNTKFWNLRFDTGFNEYLQVLGTLGGFGIIAFILFSFFVLLFAFRGLASNLYRDDLSSALSLSAILAIILLLIHVNTVVLGVAIFILLAMLMAIHKSSGKVEEFSLGIKTSRLTDSNLVTGDLLPLILLLPILILSGFIFWQLKNAVLADYYHRLALNAAANRGLDTYNYLIQAEKLNPNIDLYRTDLAQTNFALANAIAAQKGPSDASPGGSLTEQDRKNIQQLLSQAINEGKAAIALSPRSAQNWEILASIYRQISGVAENALLFSLDAYGRAIQQDPLNPSLRLSVGGVYYSAQNYDLAIRFFSDAVNLKPDYANAYYNLSIALRDKGDLQGAQSAAERVVALLQANPDSEDYKTASSYLSDLKNRIATGSAEGPKIAPPAAEQQSALEEEGLPKVLDEKLKQGPQNIATPPAVKKDN